MKLIAVLFVTALGTAFGQIVQTGRNGPHYCDKIEHVKPNLVLSSVTRLRGRIIDQTGEPFENSLVELRLYKSETQQTSVKKVWTDKDGNFDFDSIPEGQYRLLASPNRLFRQADKLECQVYDPCVLLITLQVSATDQPDMFCPVK